MTALIKQSTAVVNLRFLMVLSSDHITGATGLTPTVTISKNGGAFATPSGAVTAISNGWYQIAANATDANTLGPLDIHATAATADPTDVLDAAMVVAFDPQDAVRVGLTALPNAAAGAAGGVPLGDASARVDVAKIAGTAQTGRDIGASVLVSAGTGAGQLDVTAGVVKANLVQILATALTETAGQIAAGVKQFFNIATPTSTMNVITSLTNAPTAGDLTAAMKTSVTTAATAATPTAAAVTAIVSADVKKVNAVTVNGSGTLVSPWGP